MESMRNSLRYLAGSLLVEMLPPSRRSLGALRALLRLFVEQARGNSLKGAASSIVVPEAALLADILLLGAPANTSTQHQGGVWVTTDTAQFAAVMDAIQKPGMLILQQLDQVVLRRLARWQALGGLIEWQPLPGEQYSPTLLGYLQSLLDNPIESCV